MTKARSPSPHCPHSQVRLIFRSIQSKIGIGQKAKNPLLQSPTSHFPQIYITMLTKDILVWHNRCSSEVMAKKIITRPWQDRFSDYVPRKSANECWDWMGTTDARGYGVLKVGDKTMKAHRLSVWFHTGVQPQLFVLHTCDNTRCVNPEHLYEGTQLENMRDKSARGRCNQPCGENHYKCKLTESMVREIRSSKEPQKVLASKYGVPQPNISSIITRRSWKHIN